MINDFLRNPHFNLVVSSTLSRQLLWDQMRKAAIAGEPKFQPKIRLKERSHWFWNQHQRNAAGMWDSPICRIKSTGE